MTATILLVEPNAPEALFLTRAFAEAGIPCTVDVAGDAQAARDYLSGPSSASGSTRSLPRLVLVRLKRYEVGRFGLLRWIRKQPSLLSLVVVILSSFADPDDVSLAYGLGANSFLAEPRDPARLTKLIRGVADYWLTKNVPLPAGS